jgi:hypothetical protein
VALAKQAEDNARAAETKAAEQATIAAAARAEVCLGRVVFHVIALVAFDMIGLNQACISTCAQCTAFQDAGMAACCDHRVQNPCISLTISALDEKACCD